MRPPRRTAVTSKNVSAGVRSVDAPSVQEDDLGGDAAGEAEVVGREDDGGAGRADLADDALDFRGGGRVEARGRLVEEQHARAQRPRRARARGAAARRPRARAPAASARGARPTRASASRGARTRARRRARRSRRARTRRWRAPSAAAAPGAGTPSPGRAGAHVRARPQTLRPRSARSGRAACAAARSCPRRWRPSTATGASPVEREGRRRSSAACAAEAHRRRRAPRWGSDVHASHGASRSTRASAYAAAFSASTMREQDRCPGPARAAGRPCSSRARSRWSSRASRRRCCRPRSSRRRLRRPRGRSRRAPR